MNDNTNEASTSRCVTPVFGSTLMTEELTNMDQVDEDSRIQEEPSRSAKRLRDCSTEEEEDDWTEIKGKKKTRHGSNKALNNEMFEIYISSKELLPKQFSLARILKDNNITNVSHVKYLSPFKIRLQFQHESAAQKLLECEKLIQKGWRFQKAMQLSVCYGLIKDVDLDLSDDEILQNISCQTPAKLLSLKRLDRRNRDDGGWCPSETLRLCFDGDTLPATVRVCDINIKVFPYIHQVSQCSQCWKLGHSRKMCPLKDVICPKCGGRHENCDTLSFVCVNCKGNHISLSRNCPVYKKERKLREIMAELGCTYRKAIECYVPPENPVAPETIIPRAPVSSSCRDLFPSLTSTSLNEGKADPQASIRSTYAEIVQTKATVHNENKTSSTSSRRPPKSQAAEKKKSPVKDDWIFWDSDADNSDCHESPEEGEVKNERCPRFSELWSRIKEVIFLKQINLVDKIRCIIQICLDWFTLVSVSLVSDWPWITTLIDFVISRNA